MQSSRNSAIVSTLSSRVVSALCALLLAAAGCDGEPAPSCETGTSSCDCYNNGTCNVGLECTAGTCRDAVPDGGVDLRGAMLELFPSDSIAVDSAGDVQVRAVVRSADGTILMSTLDAPVVILWEVDDPSVATVEDDGVVRPVGTGAATLTATIEGTTTSVSLPIEIGSGALQGIVLEPASAALDVGSQRTLDVSAIDASGAPTGLACTPSLRYPSSIIDASTDVTPGDESVEVEGIAQGTALLELECGGIDATPAVIEVKPAVRIPNPSPSGDADFGVSPSLLLDSPRIHIASHDRSNGKLVYTSFDRVWHTETLDGDGTYGQSSAIVLDPLAESRPLICADEDGGLSCWGLAGDGFWTRRRVAGAAGAQPEAVRAIVARDGAVYVAYRSRSRATLEIAVSRSASRDDWAVTSLVSELTGDFDMAPGPDDLPRFVLHRQPLVLYGSMDASLALTLEQVDTEVLDASSARLAIGRDNRPQLAYVKNGNLVHALRAAGEWRIGVVESVDAEPGSLTIDVDRHGQPRVAYVDARDRMLRYAYRLRTRRVGSPNRWRIESPEAASVATSHSELRVDPEDRAHIATYRGGTLDYYVEPYGFDYSDPSALTIEDASNTLAVESGPPGPTNLSLTGLPDALTVQWDSVEGASGYRVYHRLGAPPTRADPYYEAGAATFFALPDPLPVGRTYFAVSAVVDAVETALSLPIDATLLAEEIDRPSWDVINFTAIAFDGSSFVAAQERVSAPAVVRRVDVTTFAETEADTFNAASAIIVGERQVFAMSAADYYYSAPGASAWSRGRYDAPCGDSCFLPDRPLFGVMSGGVIHMWVNTGSPHPCRDRSDLNCPSVVRYQCTPSADLRTMACTADDVGDGFDDVVVAGARWFDGSTDSTIPKNAGVIDGWAYLAMVRYTGPTMMLVRCELATGRYETLEVPLMVPFTAPSAARFTEHAIVHGGRIHALYAPDSRVRLMTYDPSTGVATERANVFVSTAYFLHCRTHGERGYCGRPSTSGNQLYRLATEAL